MQKGTITVVDGFPTLVTGRNEIVTSASPNESLDDLLANLRKAGWIPDGELPPHPATGSYQIPLIKPQ